MGVTLSRNGFLVIGALHKIYNVLSIDFIGDQYFNIMGHTSEHLQQVISKVRLMTENIVNGKPLLGSESHLQFGGFYM